MSPDEETPEEVSLQAGKVAFDDRKKDEEHQSQRNNALKKQRKDKRKRVEEKKRVSQKKAVKLDGSVADGEAEQEMDLLPEAVVTAVLGRVGNQEVADRKTEPIHGQIVNIGRKHLSVKVQKGPVIVQVLDTHSMPGSSDNALGFRDKVLGRHRRSKSMLRR